MTSDEIDRYVRDQVADWPPLTDHQRAVIAVVMKPVESGGKSENRHLRKAA